MSSSRRNSADGGWISTGLPVVGLLGMSTASSVISHSILSSNSVDPTAQTLAWCRYFFCFLFSAIQCSFAPTVRVPDDVKWKMTKIGIFDSTAYGLACYGFAECGVAYQMIIFSAFSPSCSALLTRFWLRKRLSREKIAAVAVVIVGLLTSAIPQFQATEAARSFSVSGVACTFFSALLYSYMGVMYESLGESRPPHREAIRRINMIGTMTVSGYMLFYTFPRREVLLIAPQARSNTPASSTLWAHIAFGVACAIRVQFQSRVFLHHGGLGMSIVNALKGPIMTVISALFLCSDNAPNACINLMSGIGSCIIGVGGWMWSTAGRADQKKQD
ncbi:hypothetical protein BSKO_03907 [Bryopsis sp. KO-2023]|nr:hypothetical protein BSKO_03907 [Bryopsis sp. KO-2023]